MREVKADTVVPSSSPEKPLSASSTDLHWAEPPPLFFRSLTCGPVWDVDPGYQWLLSKRIAHLFQFWMQHCKIHISSLVNPNWVVPILLGSWWSVVFRKNITWTLVVKFLEELNCNLKCVFKRMQTCLTHIYSFSAPKIMKFLWLAVLDEQKLW